MSTIERDDFTDLLAHLRRSSGIDFGQYRRPQLERRVRSFARDRGHDDLGAYGRLVGQDRDELAALLDRITINVSQLWRNPREWQLLAAEIPGLVHGGALRAWSAGCSYGAEAHTLAAVVRDAAPKVRLTVTGTDIDRRMVARAREGRFTDADARDAPKAEMNRWFTREDGGWRATRELAAGLRFEVGDLLNGRVRPAAYDLVLCRNTVIYFDPPVRDELHRRLATSLRPGGLLVVGATERVVAPESMGLAPVRPFVYRRES